MAENRLRLYLPAKPVLTLASLNGGDDYAELSSRYKASHIRLMVYWLATKTRKVANLRCDDVPLQVLAECLYGLSRATEIQSLNGLVLEKDCADEASQCLWTFVKGYAWLALWCQQNDLLLFTCKPKLHYLAHTADDLKSLQLNQLKLFSTFMEESFLGRVKCIATQVHGKTLTTRVFQGYILTLAVSLHQTKQRMMGMD